MFRSGTKVASLNKNTFADMTSCALAIIKDIKLWRNNVKKKTGYKIIEKLFYKYMLCYYHSADSEAIELFMISVLGFLYNIFYAQVR